MSENITPVDLMLPWLPTKIRKARKEANTKLNETFKRLYRERVEKGKVVDDAVQMLIDRGVDEETLVFVSHICSSFVRVCVDKLRSFKLGLCLLAPVSGFLSAL